jgi:hypothetical protein
MLDSGWMELARGLLDDYADLTAETIVRELSATAEAFEAFRTTDDLMAVADSMMRQRLDFVRERVPTLDPASRLEPARSRPVAITTA